MFAEADQDIANTKFKSIKDYGNDYLISIMKEITQQSHSLSNSNTRTSPVYHIPIVHLDKISSFNTISLDAW